MSNPFGSGTEERSASYSNDDKLPEKGDVDMAAADTMPPAQGQALNCPQVVAWPNERLRTVYQPGHDADAMFVIHRGEITKLSRECQFYSEPRRRQIWLRRPGAARAQGGAWNRDHAGQDPRRRR